MSFKDALKKFISKYHYTKPEIDNLLEEVDTTSNLSQVAKTGSYNDLIDKPIIPSGVEIIDNLNSNDSSKSLSAKQGKILNDNKLDSSTASNTYLSKTDASSTYVAKENGKGLFTGSYNDLTDKPTIIDNLTTNDASKVLSAKQGKVLNDNKLDSSTASNIYLSKTDASSTYVAKENGKGLFTGSYNDLTDKPVIPSKTSDLTNDSEYLTSHQDISGKVNVSDVNNWQTINLTNGVLYVNETLRLCELHYSKSGVSLPSDSWTDVETVSQIASYPHKETNDYLYVSGNMPYYTIRIYRDGKIKAYSTLSSLVAVTFSTMWHY